MTAKTGLFVQPDTSDLGTTPLGARLALAGLVAVNGDGTARAGVFYDGKGSVVTGTSSMKYSVRACVVALQTSAADGVMVGANDGALDVTTTAAPGSNSRIDVVWVRQHRVSGDGPGADSDVVLEFGCTQGTAAASPSAPAIPSGAMEVARATVTSGATATNTLTITQTHPWTVSAGAPIPVRSSTERNALTAYTGLQALRLDLNGLVESYGGSSWGSAAACSYQTLTSGQTITHDSWTIVTGWVATNHQNIDYSAGVWTVTSPGWYQIDARITFPNITSPVGQRGLRIVRGGSQILDEDAGKRGDATYNTYLTVHVGRYLSAGDTIDIRAYHSQGVGTTMSITSTAGQAHVSIVRIPG